MRTALALLLAAALACAMTAPAALAAPGGACAQIRAACRDAGFSEGGAAGAGLVRDCVEPLIGGGQPARGGRALPQVDPATVAACRAAKGEPSGPAVAPSSLGPVRTPGLASSIQGQGGAMPRGLVAVLVYHRGQTLSLAAFDNPYISGVALQIHWADIQPLQAAAPDWSALDALFARAQATHKWVQLLIFPGFFSPDWAHSPTGVATMNVQYGPEKGTPLPLPAPWDATYQADWLAFMKLVAQRYARVPEFQVLGAAGPTSVSVETTEPNSPADRLLWKTPLGYTQTRYVGAWKAVLPVLASDFPSQYLTLSGGAGTDSIVNIDASGDIVNNFHLGTKQLVVNAAQSVLGRRLGLQNSNLDGNPDTSDKAVTYILDHAGTMLTGFQLRTSVNAADMGTGTPAQKLRAAIDNGFRAGPGGHVDYIEIYDPDVENHDLQPTLAYGASLFHQPPTTPPGLPPGQRNCGTRCF